MISGQTPTNYALIYFHIILDRIFITGPTLFSILTYLLFSITTVNHIRLYNHFFKHCYRENLKLNTKQIREWTANRVNLNVIVADIEKLMSIIVFIWY
jgi:hypothetical protein